MASDKPRVFISHSWDEKAQASELERALDAAGAEVWVDHREVRGGDNFPKRISDALGWCNTLLLLWSGRSATSSWVEQEWTNAVALRKSIIPCTLDETPLPSILANRRHINFQDAARGVAELLDALDIAVTDRGPESNHEASGGMVSLRSKPVEDLSDAGVQEMLKNLHFRKHRYENAASESQKVVIDWTAGLMWQQSGSSEMSFAGPQHYIAELIKEKFAGYADWRLPTLEEAMFLVEPTESAYKLYIDEVFDSRQGVIWTADKKARWIWWAVSFRSAGCFPTRLEEHFHVRAVRAAPNG
jgi:hypothetical protein